jgi:hypothetical protein
MQVRPVLELGGLVAGTADEQSRAMSLAVRRVPVTLPGHDATTERADRMARFAAGARGVVVRAVTVGALVVSGWLLAVVFGMLFAAPASADATAATGISASQAVAKGASDSQPVATGVSDSQVVAVGASDSQAVAVGARDSQAPAQVSASDNAEAMAGRTVDGLNSQQDPGLPPPSSAGKILDTNGLVPNGGGSGPFGPGMGDVARSVFDPRLQAVRAPLACVLPPVVRTAADDPSFSPD